ncbi:MAG TPA: DUF6307 family protein [Pseudonocardiaceae bacterium]|jgi:hypothetical protein|nr:DUF6307 family protein [Pseudonocardiaceae bacterium]
MSQTYEQRLSTVEHALVAEKISSGAGKTLTDVAVKVLAALDGIKEDVR